jgi:hypothetical protein
MAVKRRTVISVFLAMLGFLFVIRFAQARDSEEQLLQKIQSEQNPVKKAKEEIRLASLKLEQLHNEYSSGHIDSGAKLLGNFMGEVTTSWKTLQTSGRKAWKQPEGFRELEISLREDVRSLEDLARGVSYFDRAPLTNAAQQLEKMRYDVLNAQFPGDLPRNPKSSGAPQATVSTGP